MYYIKKGLPSNISNDPIEDLGGKKKEERIKLSVFFFAYCHYKETHTYLSSL